MPESNEPATFDGPIIGDRFRLGPLLGRGGQGSTHLALDQQTDQRVAIKVFDLEHASSWKDLELFRRECAALRGLDHPNVPDFLDQLESDDETRAYLVMEYVPGRSLRRRILEDGPLTEDDLWDILTQVLEILAYLQKRQPPIIHRDIKPSNLLERPDGRLALVDFGGVRLRRRPNGGSTVVGTMGYMAPEQLYGDASTATDIYALGNSIIALASGEEPENLPRRGLQIDVERALSVSQTLERVLSRMTAPDPSDRPASAADLLDEIASFSRPDDAAPLSTPLPPQLANEQEDSVTSTGFRRLSPASDKPDLLRRRSAKTSAAVRIAVPLLAMTIISFALIAPGGRSFFVAFLSVILPIALVVLVATRWLLTPKRARARLRTPGFRSSRPRQLPTDDRTQRGTDAPRGAADEHLAVRSNAPRSRPHSIEHQQRHRNRNRNRGRSRRR